MMYTRSKTSAPADAIQRINKNLRNFYIVRTRSIRYGEELIKLYKLAPIYNKHPINAMCTRRAKKIGGNFCSEVSRRKLQSWKVSRRKVGKFPNPCLDFLLLS